MSPNGRARCALAVLLLAASAASCGLEITTSPTSPTTTTVATTTTTMPTTTTVATTTTTMPTTTTVATTTTSNYAGNAVGPGQRAFTTIFDHDANLAECSLGVLEDLGFDEYFQRVRPNNEFNLRFPTALRDNCSDDDFHTVIIAFSVMLFDNEITDGACEMVDLLYNEAPLNSRAEDLLLDALVDCPRIVGDAINRRS